MRDTVLNFLLCIISFSFNLPSNPGGKSCHYDYFYKWWKWEADRLKKLSKVTQVVSGRAGVFEPRGSPTNSSVTLPLWQSPQVPKSTVVTKVTFASSRKVTQGSRLTHLFHSILYSSKEPIDLGCFEAQRDLKDNQFPFPTQFSHEVTEVQKDKNNMSKVKSKSSVSRILSSLLYLCIYILY